MEFRQLGASGLKVPLLSLGTATFGGGNAYYRAWGNTDAQGAARQVDICLDAGTNLFDTADVYSFGLAEEILGKAVAGRRDKVLISSKAGLRMSDEPNEVGSSRHHLLNACEASLRRLNTDYIDLWQLHGFDACTPVEETLRALDDLVTAGKIRYVGCSNFSGWHLMKSLAAADRYGWPRHVSHQVYYSLLSREFEWELMPLALDQKVGTMVWSPLAAGMLAGKLGRNRPAPEGSRVAAQGGVGPAVPQQRLYAVLDALDELSAETGRTHGQLALNWVMHRPTVTSVVIGARDEKQLRENLQAMAFHLTPEQISRLDSASAVEPVYPYWHQWRALVRRNPPPVSGYAT